MSKVLVINPLSRGTEMLSNVYEGKGYDVIQDASVSNDAIVRAIKSHDKIIMLGYGCPMGLYGIVDGERRLIINDSHAAILKNKETYSVWRDSYSFFKRNGMKGFHTGMIISDEEEAEEAGFEGYTYEQIQESLIPLVEALRDTEQMKDLDAARQIIFSRYCAEDPITTFNRTNITIIP